MGVPRQTNDPTFKITSFVNEAHFALPLADVLNEVSHDIGEESDTTEHDDNCDDHLHVTDWKDIAITHGRQGCDGEITGLYDLSSFCLLIFQEYIIPCSIRIILSLLRIELLRDEEPATSKKVRDEHTNEYESEDLVNVHYKILFDDLLIIGCFSINTFNKLTDL